MLEINYGKIFKSLGVIQSHNYIKGKINIVLGVIVTLATLFAGLSFKEISIGDSHTIVGYDPFVVASGIGVTTIRICMYNTYRNLYMFRKANVFQRLFSTPVSKTFVFFSIMLFNGAVNIGVCAGLFGFAMIFSAERARLVGINWLMVLSGFCLLSIFCSLFAFLLAFGIGFTQKKFELALVIASVFYFGSIYILGLGIPYSLILSKSASSGGFARLVYWAGYFLVVKYPLNIMQAGGIDATSMKFLSSPTNDFGTADGFGYGYHLGIPYVVSVVTIVLTSFAVAKVCVKNYEIGLKQYKRVFFIKVHMKNIAEIKKVSSISELEAKMQYIRSQRMTVKEFYNEENKKRRVK